MVNPQQFASAWAESWNRRALEEVLAHFHVDVVFTSPTALAVTGSAVVHGRDALRAYWNTAMTKIHSLQFTVDRVLWDAARRELAIIYTADINGSAKKVSENLAFDEAGEVIAAEVFHGVAMPGRQP
jgi:ketosteroid isomerase-like protein